MIESIFDGNLLIQRISGALTVRDMLEARQYSAQHIQEDCSVVWDLRDSVLMESDEAYQVFIKATVNLKTTSTSVKRAFLVSSARHVERVELTLGKSNLPWAWGVFQAEEEAIAWLNG